MIDNISTESAEQIALFRWADMQRGKYPELEIMYHVPNGGARHIATAARMKAEGVKPGVPDICLPVARHGYHGLYIEMKRCAGGRVSPAQTSYIGRLRLQGYAVAVCYGWEAASVVIRRYMDDAAGEDI